MICAALFDVCVFSLVRSLASRHSGLRVSAGFALCALGFAVFRLPHTPRDRGDDREHTVLYLYTVFQDKRQTRRAYTLISFSIL